MLGFFLGCSFFLNNRPEIKQYFTLVPWRQKVFDLIYATLARGVYILRTILFGRKMVYWRRFIKKSVIGKPQQHYHVFFELICELQLRENQEFIKYSIYLTLSYSKSIKKASKNTSNSNDKSQSSWIKNIRSQTLCIVGIPHYVLLIRHLAPPHSRQEWCPKVEEVGMGEVDTSRIVKRLDIRKKLGARQGGA